MKLNEEQFAAFSMEIATFGNIPILSRYCGIGCVFCKVHTDSYLGQYPRIPEIDEEDLLKGFDYINPKVRYVRLGAGVLVAPHTDPFLHPKIYDFIKMASDRFPEKTITTVTTGAYIDENKLEYLCSIPNYGIDLSLITMQEQRESIIPRSERERTMRILKDGPVNKCTIMFTGNLDEMKRDLERLHELGIHTIGKHIIRRDTDCSCGFIGYFYKNLHVVVYARLEQQIAILLAYRQIVAEIVIIVLPCFQSRFVRHIQLDATS